MHDCEAAARLPLQHMRGVHRGARPSLPLDGNLHRQAQLEVFLVVLGLDCGSRFYHINHLRHLLLQCDEQDCRV